MIRSRHQSVFANVFMRLAAAGLLTAALVPSVAAADDKARALTDAYNASGRQLYGEIARKERGNIVLSPYSIGTAMAMTLSGARGATETEMASALKHSLDRDARDDAATGVAAVLNGYGHGCGAAERTPVGREPVDGVAKATRDGSAGEPASSAAASADRPAGDTAAAQGTPNDPAGRPAGESAAADGTVAGDKTPQPRLGESRPAERRPAEKPVPCLKLNAANALFLAARGDVISQAYAELLDTKYGARLFRNARVEDVNGFVKERTEGKIEKLLERLDRNAAAVLVNAVYFKGLWAKPFDKENTQDGDFRLSATETVKVAMMRKEDGYQTVPGQGFSAIRLPYNPAAVGLVIVLPDKVDGAAKAATALDAKGQAQLFAALRAAEAKPVDLSLPRFKISSRADLVEPFRKLGIKLAFDDLKADFSGMAERKPNPPLSIGQIEHRAVIEVSEEGTEAAAATAVVMLQRSYKPRPEPEAFHVDRPFLFYIVDDATGAVLFEGRVSDPRGGETREAATKR